MSEEDPRDIWLTDNWKWLKDDNDPILSNKPDINNLEVGDTVVHKSSNILYGVIKSISDRVAVIVLSDESKDYYHYNEMKFCVTHLKLLQKTSRCPKFIVEVQEEWGKHG